MNPAEIEDLASFPRPVDTERSPIWTQRARGRRSDLPLPAPGDEDVSDVSIGSDEMERPRRRAQRVNRLPLAPGAHPREAVVAPEPKTFSTHALPAALAKIATHSGWLDARVASGRFEGLTGRQILQDDEIYLCGASEDVGETKRPAPASPPSPSWAPGSSLVCGRVPPSSLLLSPERSLLLPSGRFSSLVFLGCSTVLVPPPDRATLLSLEFLVVTETETEVTHSYVREMAWIVLLPDEELSIETAKPEQRRKMGCGCETNAVECQGCGAVVGYGLLSGAACGRHFGPAYAFDPARVRVVPPLSPSGTTKKRKRVNATPSSSSSREPGPAAACDLRPGQVSQATTAGGREPAGDVSGPDGGDMADETAVEASLTEARRIVGR